MHMCRGGESFIWIWVIFSSSGVHRMAVKYSVCWLRAQGLETANLVQILVLPALAVQFFGKLNFLIPASLTGKM